MSFLESASTDIGEALPSGAIVVNKSTVPVGSTRVVERVLNRPDVRVVSNPEFLREGSAVRDFLKPDRIVIGADDREAAIKVSSLYIDIAAPVVFTDPATAETIKYAANAFLAAKLSFVNAIAAVCEGVGADIDDLVVGLGLDRRIGEGFLRPGPGWGGSCFPKDTRALLRIAEDAGYRFGLLEGVLAVNEQQFDRVVEKVRTALDGRIEGAVVAVWGLTFKANTDDLRESPAIAIIERLQSRGATVRAWDPAVSAPNPLLPQGLELGDDPYAVCQGADVLAVLTEWDETRWLDARKVAEALRRSRVVDARNVLDRSEWVKAGFEHQGIGR
jgi:UDPglucose 6-dehydrogenase